MKRKKAMKFLRSTAFAVVCCFMCAIIGTSGPEQHAYADEYDDKIAATEREIAQKEEKIKELDGKIKQAGVDIADSEEVQSYYWQKLVAQKEQFDLLKEKLYYKEEEIALKESEIGLKEEDIIRVEGRIEEKEAQIADKISEIEKLDAHNRENIYKFGQIIRTMYINGSDDVLSVLEGSTDFYDIFVRTEIMESASKQNLDFMNSLLDDIHRCEEEKLRLEKDKEKLEEDKKQLEEDKEQLEEEREALEDERTEFDEQRKYTETLIGSYTDEYNSVTSKISNLEYLQNQYKQQQQVTREEIEAYEKKIDEYIRQQQLAASNTVVYQDGDWQWPLDPKFHLITTYFGYSEYHGKNHGAIDIGNGGINGANIYAMKSGEVIVAKTTYTKGYDYGMYIVIDHGNGYQSLYAHCSAVYVTVGQMVQQGETIGAVGSTGWSTGPHLHFEIRKDGNRVDPLNYVAVPTV